MIVTMDRIGYDSVYLTCSKKLTGSQLSLPHEINKKLKCETKNKMMNEDKMMQCFLGNRTQTFEWYVFYDFNPNFKVIIQRKITRKWCKIELYL